MMNKIYWSRHIDAEHWVVVTVYKFPFAYKLMEYQYGRQFLMCYLIFRAYLKELFK